MFTTRVSFLFFLIIASNAFAETVRTFFPQTTPDKIISTIKESSGEMILDISISNLRLEKLTRNSTEYDKIGLDEFDLMFESGTPALPYKKFTLIAKL